ncbi:MAG: RHS repeat domain-containing protein [Caulobacter sp.]
MDDLGVDLLTGSYRVAGKAIAIGQPGSGGLSYGRVLVDGSWTDMYQGTINWSCPHPPESPICLTEAVYTVSFGATSESFTQQYDKFLPAEGQVSTLTYDEQTETYSYTKGGVTIKFDRTLAASWTTQPSANRGRVSSVTYPSGEILTFRYATARYIGDGLTYNRLQSVSNNLGYQLKFMYDLDAPVANDAYEMLLWTRLKSVHAINNAVDECSPEPVTCVYTEAWPSLEFSVPNTSIDLVEVDSLGQSIRYVGGATGVPATLTGVRKASSPDQDSVTITYSGGKVSSVSTRDGVYRSYAYEYVGSTLTVLRSDPLGSVWASKFDTSQGLLIFERDPSGLEARYSYDHRGRLVRIERTEGDAVEYKYDSRGNVIQITQTAKVGFEVPPIVTYAEYPSSCTNLLTCNKPTSTIDERGNTTNYEYDPDHGALVRVTLPPPEPGAVRPEIRYTYGEFYAYYKMGDGVVEQASTPVIRATSEASCISGLSCASSPDELRYTVAYVTSGAATNLLPLSVTQAAGDGSTASTRTFTYTQQGDIASINGPVPGDNDVTHFRYDAGRRLVRSISPDPDGSTTTLKPRARRLVYNADDQVVLEEVGTVSGPTDADWPSFAVLRKSSYLYDGAGRLVRRVQQASNGSALGVVQYSYDIAGRQECTAVRMNPAIFSTLPTSACAQGAPGASGPDQIRRTTFDRSGRPIAELTSVGTPQERRVLSVQYSPSGRIAGATDARGALTIFEYDGFDRLQRIRHPDADQPGIVSALDSEQYSYDEASRVIAYTNRSGQSYEIAYDALGRAVSVNGPNGVEDTAYTYDNLGRMTSAVQASSSTTWSYDALGRTVSETTALGTVTYEYDQAGRRTKLAWPDGFFVTYTYDNLNRPKSIRQSGMSSGNYNIATYSYDNAGRRKSITRANSVTSTWSYDAGGRPSSLIHNFPGTSPGDVSFSFTWTPAWKSASRGVNNSLYEFNPLGSGSVKTEYNQLNQAVAEASVPVGHDGNGNVQNYLGLQSEYDSANRLVEVQEDVSVRYDSSGRLSMIESSVDEVHFLYDGENIIGEYAEDGSLRNRYVFGPDEDEPVLWLDSGGSLSNRRWLIPDERRSVVSIANNSGGLVQTNTYDEYGVPGSGNLGRFQFTGQVWIAEAGAYHFKARQYQPYRGRFAQPDPLGYRTGMNLYAYAGLDPINRRDPSGRAWVEQQGVRCLRVYEEGGAVVCDLQFYTYMTWVPDFGDLMYFDRGFRSIRESLERAKICPVARAEVVGGAVVEAGVTVSRVPGPLGNIGAEGSLDAASIRGGIGIGFDGLEPYADITQGASVDVGWVFNKISARVGRKVERSKGQTSFGDVHWETPQFIGLDVGGAFILGGNARIGVELGVDCDS